MDSLGDELLVSRNGELVKVSTATLKGKTLGLYFSAHWCPPCQRFTPRLVTVYQAVKQRHPDFEIVFVSLDRQEAKFKEYFDSMPWMAIPFEASALRNRLASAHGVSGIPCLVILNQEGEVTAQNAVGAVISDDETGTQFPWEGAGAGGTARQPMNYLLVVVCIIMLLRLLKIPEYFGFSS
mmetsp:Transcript_39964/g.113306  ORF Transcript_39964/g.113306 Transcript_39964/m.113306 type:complete len:181 (-) Transcript_39964:108-650(-)